MSTTAEERPTTVRAQARFVRTAPRKAQLVVDQIRGRSVPEARTILAFLTRAAAQDVEKVLSSAVANAEANHGLIGDDLYVAEAYVGDGPMLKRYRARARGRVARIRKRTCHITVVLATPPDYEFIELPEAPPAVAEAPEPETEMEETAEPFVDEGTETPTDEAVEEPVETEVDEPEEDEPASTEAEAAPAEEVEPEAAAETEPAAETAIEESEAAETTQPADESVAEPNVTEQPAEEEAPKKPRRRSSSRKKAAAEESSDEAADRPAPKRRTRKKADETDEEGKEG